MAKARETTAPDPAVESEEEESGDEEEEEASEEENQGSESESEPEGPTENAKKSSSNPAPATKKPESLTAKSQTPAPASSSSEDEESSGSETDTDSPPKKPDPSIKPIASKPMNEPDKPTATKKPRSKPNASGPTSPTRPTTSAGAKRPAPAATTLTMDADGKRSKRKLAENSEKKGTPNDEGKKLFVRVWSEDDEIAILRGMIDYSVKKKADPVADLNAFHEFIKNKINIDVTRTQLQDKIRRLRKKYENNAGKEKNGKERTFSNPHEQKAYDLSKKVWGIKKAVGEETLESPKANGSAMRKGRSKGAGGTTPKIEGAEEEAKEEKSLVSEKNKSFSFALDGRPIDGWVFNGGMELMEEDDRVEMEKKWKQFRTEEAGLLVKRMELSLEHVKKVFDGMKSSGD